MKQKLQAAIAMVFLFTNAFGQTAGSSSEKIRSEQNTTQTYLDPILNLVSTNLNYGSLNTSLSGYKKPVLSAQVGASFQAGISPDFSLASEIYFMMKGGKLKAHNPLTANETTLRFYSFEIPVLARVHLGKLYVNAGPSLAYNLSGRKKVEEVSKSIEFDHSIEGFKRFEAGVQMGGGYMFPWKQGRIALDLRYNHGLTNISYDKEMYNRSFIVSVHISQPWKRNPLGKAKHS